MLVLIFAAVSNASNHFVEFIAIVPFGDVFQFPSEQIAVLPEEKQRRNKIAHARTSVSIRNLRTKTAGLLQA